MRPGRCSIMGKKAGKGNKQCLAWLIQNRSAPDTAGTFCEKNASFVLVT